MVTILSSCPRNRQQLSGRWLPYALFPPHLEFAYGWERWRIWQAHTVRGAMSGALKERLGMTVTSEPHDARGRVYRLTA
ncbi:hypothetical protein DKT77_18945 [Meridianimarinicoccus roseus]|uniref:Uncharacterized protein n=1 Tax=Meridianimarinicoccus roseus TaxID=2072018 RepID=A0A2V2LF18_9RHOB|nr:hypothetical protein DKT77_18945 [Meridianimarinicoccus roseus]